MKAIYDWNDRLMKRLFSEAGEKKVGGKKREGNGMEGNRKAEKRSVRKNRLALTVLLGITVMLFVSASVYAGSGSGRGDAGHIDNVVGDGVWFPKIQMEEGKESENAKENMIYGIGSTSKMVAAAAVMKLSEEGKIDLDAPLVDYIPEFEMEDIRYLDITPRMLLDHSSGIPGSTLTNAMLLGDPDTYNHDHLLEVLRGQRLKADPGAYSTYCNDGFTLAELLVERVSGMSFTEYMDREFKEPLGLAYFGSPQSGYPSDRIAPVYDGKTGWKLPSEAANVIGSGGIYTTAEDLCLFSQIFMENGKSKSILSKDSLEQMRQSTYGSQLKISGRDTTLEYGLGWDSVNTYPFNRYGITALSKGGDTIYYHASLTVLPEEGISCALLSSGGSSTFNQVAVQEILLSYLEEIDRIERNREMEDFDADETYGVPEQIEAEQMGAGLSDWSGWYAGKDFFEVDMKENGTLSLAGSQDGYSRTQTYQYRADGRFHSTRGAYVGATGELTKNSGGQIGSSTLEFMESKNGARYLMAGVREVYPGLGTTACYLPIGVQMTGEEVNTEGDSETRAAWADRDGKEYYLVSDKYSSAAYFTRFMVKPKITENPEGYLTFEDSVMAIAKLQNPSLAVFFHQVPGQAGRDLSDYAILEKEGKEYLVNNSNSFISEDDVESLPGEDTTITIGPDGEAVWFYSDEQHKNRPLAIDTPDKGAFFVYDHSGKKMTCVAGSYLGADEQQILLPGDGRILFAGEAGALFTIHYED